MSSLRERRLQATPYRRQPREAQAPGAGPGSGADPSKTPHGAPTKPRSGEAATSTPTFDFEGELSKYKSSKEGARDVAASSNYVDLFTFPEDDTREIIRDRSHRSVDLKGSPFSKLSSTSPSSSTLSSQQHQVQSCLALYKSDWRGVERHYRNIGIKEQPSLAHLPLPLFESGPNVSLPDAPEDDESDDVDVDGGDDAEMSTDDSAAWTAASSPALLTSGDLPTPGSPGLGTDSILAPAGVSSVGGILASSMGSDDDSIDGGGSIGRRSRSHSRHHRHSSKFSSGAAMAGNPTAVSALVEPLLDPSVPDPLRSELLAPPSADDKGDDDDEIDGTATIAGFSSLHIGRSRASTRAGSETPSISGLSEHVGAAGSTLPTVLTLPTLPKVTRQDLFGTLYRVDEPPEPHMVSNPYLHKFGTRFWVEPKELTFNLGNVEPFFCTMALYDLNKKTRISENFYYDINTDDNSRMLAVCPDKLIFRRQTSAIFSVAQPSADIWLVLRVEKVLQGDEYDRLVEPYSKYETMKDKDREKLTAAAASACARGRARFHAPFCWGMIPVFNEDRQLALGTDTKIGTLHRYKVDTGDQNFFELLSDYSRTGSSKKMKVIPGKLVIDAGEWTPAYEREMLSKKAILDCDSKRVVDPLGMGADVNIPSLDEEVVSSPSSSSKHKSSRREKDSDGSSAATTSAGALQEIAAFPEEVYPFTSARNTLYVYPNSVTLTKTGSNTTVAARNIAVKVQLMESDDISKPALASIYNRNQIPHFTDAIYTAVNYHNKTPQFYDEVKIELPSMLTPRHNLLFTFCHISCKDPKPGATSDEQIVTPVGYAFIPVLFKGRILEKDIAIPLISELPVNYLSPESEASMRQSVIDAKKVVFKFRLRLCSTLYTSDKYLNGFFQEYRKPKMAPERMSELVRDLLKAKPARLVQYLPTVLNLLFHVIVHESNNSNSLVDDCLHVLVELLSLLQHSESVTDISMLLVQYLDHVFMNQPASVTTTLYQYITAAWLRQLKRAQTPAPSSSSTPTALEGNADSASGTHLDAERLNRYAWFLLKLVAKSMAANVVTRRAAAKSTTSQPNSRSKKKAGEEEDSASIADEDRPERFTKEYTASLRQLVILQLWEIQVRMKSGITIFKDVIKRLAHFICDLAAVMDRGIVFDLVSHVVTQLAPYPEEVLEFMRIITNYEHYPQLNFPVSIKLDAAAMAKPEELWNKRHVLAGLVLKVLAPNYTQDKMLRLRALSMLHALFLKHDMDPRLKNRRTKRRLVQIYFPYIVTVIDNLEEYKKRDFDEQRSVFGSFVYILKHIDPYLLKLWWRRDTLMRQVGFIQALQVAASTFEHVGERVFLTKLAKTTDASQTSVLKAAFEEFYGGKSAMGAQGGFQSLREKRMQAAQRQRNTASVSLGRPLAGTGDRRWKHLFAGMDPDAGDYVYDEVRESNLAQEVSFVLLDTIELFLKEKHADLSAPHQPNLLMDATFGILMTLLQRRQSIPFIIATLAQLRVIVFKYPKQLFTMNTTYCAQLTAQILHLCNYQSPNVRVEASAFLFLLMKRNYENSNGVGKKRNFTRVKVQTIIALSKLVGQGKIKEPTFLKRALKAVQRYANQYNEATESVGTSPNTTSSSPLAEQVEQTTQRLLAILEDSVKINQHSNDPEMLADLYHRIAASYRNAPDLRVTWLESLAAVHSRHAPGTSSAAAHWAEAAQCSIHIAALIAEYLISVEPVDGLPQGCAPFEVVCPSALEEQEMLAGTIGSGGLDDDQEGINEATNTFTEQGLIRVMQQAINHLVRAQLYEQATELYKLLLPVYEKNRDYANLAASHLELHDIHKKIIDALQSQSRVLGTYYRVFFLGEKFGELNEQEYIYKEPRLTRLGEICDRLTALYGSKLGVTVELYTKSGDVDKSKMDLKNKCYVQITHVTPYFDEWEIKERKTDFARNNNINQFIFETPFTKSSKAHAEDLADQYKRKTILVVEQSFPYMKKRLPVVQKKIVELNPIENSLELIGNKTEILRQELLHPSAKTLQLVLQGSVLAQVHAGPTQICKTFLSKPDVKKYNQGSTEKLRRNLQEFLDVCGEALSKNRELITPTQLSFHQELEEGYKKVREVMEPLLAD